MKKQYVFCRMALLCAWLFSPAAYAEIKSGDCGAEGSNVTWMLDTGTGVLEISGTGEMFNYSNKYSSPGSAPWYNRPVKTVIIGDGVTTIGSWAFWNCDGLTEITIPESVTTIGDDAFSDCDGLTSVMIPESVTTIGYEAFDSCDNLTEITIPESVTTIGESAFSFCDSLKVVTIGNGVTTIGDKAFYYCDNLKAVTIGNGVTTIGESAFSFCTNLEKFEGKFTSNGCCLIVNDTLIAFAPKCEVTEYIIPDGVTTIGSRAFYDCDNLISVTIPNSVVTIGERAFSFCSGLMSVTIPESVTSIGESAFSFCTNLEKFEGKFTSNGCCLIVNDTLIAFAPKCEVIEYIIPNGVTVICDGAFSGCSGLTSVTIPESVTSISSSAFSGCTGLRTITSLDSIPPRIIYSDTFDNDTYKNATVNYPKGSLHAYKTATGWENFTYPTAQALLNPQISSDAGETTCRITVSYTRDIDYPVWRLTFRMGEEQFTLDTTQTSISITATDLEPQTEYEAKFFVETKSGDLLTCETSFTTDTVKLTTLPAINISNTSATLTADIECDAVIGAGFEWRRYDDPELVPSTFSETPIVDGKISGTLRNLTPEKYYKYRPFYRTVKGKYYYGAWLAFGTRDVYAYFEPTVSTRSGEVHGNNSTISGYIVEGSDELLSQGFEYWAESPAARSTESIATRSTASNPERIEGSGSLMSVTLTGLAYNTTYYYRAYATTAKKTTYGNTESFTTGEDPNLSGIEETKAEANAGFEVRLSGIPVRNGEIGVQVVGADGAIWYRVISLHGAQIAQGVLSDTDEWQPVKIPAASTGYYLLQIISSKGTKTLRIVVE